MDKQTREQIALIRYKIISPVLAEPARLQNEKKGSHRKTSIFEQLIYVTFQAFVTLHCPFNLCPVRQRGQFSTFDIFLFFQVSSFFLQLSILLNFFPNLLQT